MPSRTATRPTRLDRRAYTSGNFLFHLDGDGAPIWVKSVSGGGVRGNVTGDSCGPAETSTKHITTLEVEPIAVDLGMDMAAPIFSWIQDCWRRRPARRDGEIVHADGRYHEAVVQSFTGALLTEVSFPTLDASSQEAAYLSFKLQPETMALTRIARLDRLRGEAHGDGQKRWLACNFRLRLFDGPAGRGRELDCAHVSKVDGFSVQQRIQKLHTGAGQFPEIEPVAIEFPTMSFHVALAHAEDFIRWQDEFLLQGGSHSGGEKQGFLELLDPRCEQVLLTIELHNVGLSGLSIENSDASASAVKRCKVEVYLESMKLTGMTGL